MTAELDPKAKRERPALKTCAAHEKALGHGSGEALELMAACMTRNMKGLTP